MRIALSAVIVASLLATSHGGHDVEFGCCGPESAGLVHAACIFRDANNSKTRSEAIKLNCPLGRYLIDPNLDPDEIFVVEHEKLTMTNGHVFERGQFCIGKIAQPANSNQVSSEVALVCFPEFNQHGHDHFADNKLFVSGILALVSVVFLVITLAVYLTLPQLRDLQGKCMMCVCMSMVLGFLSLSVAQLAPANSGTPLCSSNAFLIYFWMMATFLWMNVVAINVWRSIVLTRSRMKESTQFMWYSGYAWGVAVGMLLITIITNYVEGSHINPGLGSEACWFSGRTETWAYFYGPIVVFLLCNILLFVHTSIKLWALNKDYDNVHNIRNLKFKFLMYLKLFLVMGISWIFEIASFVHGDDGAESVIWYITDVVNCLQGLLFFLVLVVFRKKAMRGLAERNLLGCFSGAARARYAEAQDEECEEILECVGGDETATPMTP